VALIVTLIMLAVITFMAVTFLVLSQRQRDTVATSIEQAAALRAAETAARRALVEIMAPIKASNNQWNFDLRVSTNYINPNGFVRGLASYTNVSYAYYPSGAPVTPGTLDFAQLQTHLLYSPRPPVYVNGDFRYYLDLNRNGRYDTNGLMTINGQLVVNPVTGQPVPIVGDPEWIGILERPEYPHSGTNPFVARFAYIAIPASKTLDQNCIGNYAKANIQNGPFPLTMAAGDGFSRNQGVGPWEINPAAFLVDLNTNLWPCFEPTVVNGVQRQPYVYRPYFGGYPDPNTGQAFYDALALMRYRYNTQYKNLEPVAAVFGGRGVSEFANDGFDDFGSGPIMTYDSPFMTNKNPSLSDPDLAGGRLATPYPGAGNPYHFFTPEDYFDVSKTALGVNPNAPNLTTSLLLAGQWPTNFPTSLRPPEPEFYYEQYYNHSTFYRLLAQLGTDSAPQPDTRLHLNYANVDALGRVVPNMATNFIPWLPVQFFTNAAVRLLANAGYTVGIGPNPNLDPNNLIYSNANGSLQLHIQIWPTNYYTPSVHRLLQLAANIYDATTNSVDPAYPYPYLPSVFHPIFTNATKSIFGPIYIVGYQEAVNASMAGLGPGPTPVMRDLSSPRDRALLGQNPNDMVYGVPAVVGAKKGLPNFNEFAMETMIQLTRKLEFRRPDAAPTAPVNQTNQMLLLCVSNVFGMEAWNSYRTNYPRNLQVIAAADSFATITVTNEQRVLTCSLSNQVSIASTTNVPGGTWPGYTSSGAFKLPLNPATNGFITLDGTYLASTGQFTNAVTTFERGLGFPVPHFWFSLRTRARFILVDTTVTPHRIVDYVNLDSTSPPLDITQIAQTNGLCEASYIPDGGAGSLWCTNRHANLDASPTYGVLNQIGICLGSLQPDVNAGRWNNAANGVNGATTDAINFFRGQLYNTSRTQTNKFYAPYEPTRTIFYETSWQANDPLVHYMIGDLISPVQATNAVQVDTRGLASTMNNLGFINGRYQPWGSPPGQVISGNVQDTFNLALKDPMVTKSDDWEFPAYKLPNPGWLGRIHRGTPWQTIYLKSAAVDYPHWRQWSGDIQIVTNWGQISTSLVNLFPAGTNPPLIAQLNAMTYDALFTHPTNDYYLVDLFTTALDDTISRGQMSINQSGLAAWSAVLSGVDVLVTSTNDAIIQPAGAYSPLSPPPLVTLWSAINNVRETNFVGHAFPRLGDILKVPELTVNSPFIARNASGVVLTNQLNDAVYERIPQQIFGLLKGGEQPRFVIYAYGQALKPANNSTVAGGLYSGLHTNYQITAEAATRTVVRIDGAPSSPRAVIESFSVLPPD
jgi:type II secretory pathway pseudopilin PulG